MKQTLLLILSILALITGGVMMLALLARTYALSSLAVARFTLVGASQTDVWIADPDHPGIVEKISDISIAHSSVKTFAEIPSELLAVVDKEGRIKGLLGDFKTTFVLGSMLLGGVLFLIGIFGLVQLWIVPNGLLGGLHFFFYCGLALFVLTIVVWGGHLLFILKTNKLLASDQRRLVTASEKLAPGQNIVGTVEKKYIDESYEARFNTLTLISTIVVRVPELFPYPVFIECTFGFEESAQKTFSALNEGISVNLIVKDDYRVVCVN